MSCGINEIQYQNSKYDEKSYVKDKKDTNDSTMFNMFLMVLSSLNSMVKTQNETWKIVFK